MPVFTRTLNFKCFDLGRDATLHLTFGDQQTIPGIYEEILPKTFGYVCIHVLY